MRINLCHKCQYYGGDKPERRYWQNGQSYMDWGKGDCRRRAKTYCGEYEGWPEVKGDDWCGEFKVRK